MQVTYQLQPAQAVTVSPSTNSKDEVKVGEGFISWNVDTENQLKDIFISFKGMPIEWTHDKLIDTSYSRIRPMAYRLGLYIANRLFLQTNVDGIQTQPKFELSATIQAETPDEVEILKKHRRRVQSSVEIVWSHVNDFEPSNYDDLFSHSEALANYSDGMRVSSLFLKFQQFYKVVEYFVPMSGIKFDRAVSRYAVKFNAQFTEGEIGRLRELRNRCTHPKHGAGHVSSERVAGMAEVERNLDSIRELALLFLKNPPQ